MVAIISKRSIFASARKALERAKDTIGSGNQQTIILPGLNEKQALAVGSLISMARVKAVCEAVPFLRPLIEPRLDDLAFYFTVLKPEIPGEPIRISFTLELDNIMESVRREDVEIAEALHAYDIEASLKQIESFVLFRPRDRVRVGIEHEGRRLSMIGLGAVSAQNARATANLIGNIVDAYGYNQQNDVLTALSYTPPMVLIKEKIYDEIYNNEAARDKTQRR